MSLTNGVVTLLPAPEGYVVDFVNPQRTGIPETYWVIGVGNFIALLFLCQRLYTKIILIGKFKWDDAFFVLSWACCVTVQILCCHLYLSGTMGVHAWEIPIDQFSNFSLLVMVSSAVYAPGTCFAKLSLLCFYHRLTTIRWFRITTICMVLFVIGGYSGILLSLVFGCNPIRKTWDVTAEGTCINTAALYIATAVLGVVSDLILLAMPIPIVLGLQLRTFQKAGLIFLFAVGSMTLVTSVVRLVLLFPMLVDFDATWAVVEPFKWICIEANLLIICASLGTLRKFTLHVAPSLMKTIAFASSHAHVTPRKEDHSKPRSTGSGGSGDDNHRNRPELNGSLYGVDPFRGSTDVKVEAQPTIESDKPEEGETRGRKSSVRDEGESARAILRTKVTTVIVEPGTALNTNPYHRGG